MKAVTIKFSGDRCLSCRTCELACAVEHTGSAGINEAVCEIPKPIPRLQVVLKKDKTHLRRCMHCKKPKCVEVCESGALRKENDVVLLDREKCNGCWQCIDACPFDAVQKWYGLAVKCDLCGGSDPACVAACPTEALTIKGG